METAIAYIVDVLLVASLTATTIAVVGMYRFDDPYLRLHAASTATFAGVVPLFVALFLVGSGDLLTRAALAVVFLVIVLPVSVHALGRARFVRSEDRNS